MTLPRRTFLRGMGAAGSVIRLALPPLAAMFNSHGTSYAAGESIPSRFLLWFNGNGIPERFWIPFDSGTEYELTPCLAPLAPFRKHLHVISGLDSPNARVAGTGNEHMRSMSALVSGERFTGSGAGAASIDQLIAARIGTDTRFRSIQVGVCQESFGHSMQRNLSWAGRDRPLPPEVIPHKLFDRLFGTKDYGWVNRKMSVLDAVYKGAESLGTHLGSEDKKRVDEYLASVRDMERAILQLPPDYAKPDAHDMEADPRDWPAVAKIQSDLIAHAFASGQTRVTSYMLTKCQSLTRFPWLGLGSARHHDYTHTQRGTIEHQEVMRDICRWHVEEFAYLLGKLNSMPEGAGTLLDRTCLLYLHEHAEANDHKNSGMAAIVAGHAAQLVTGRHTRTTGTVGDLYMALANRVLGAGIDSFPTSSTVLRGVVA
ncbi:MAG: DUF1552 domain-containing protein [Candidatus Solibacter usitatus]|nr:DUF1552 domain-containing protein [Candidatus Solibacter usitatus]